MLGRSRQWSSKIRQIAFYRIGKWATAGQKCTPRPGSVVRREAVLVLRREQRTWVPTVREEFATYYPLAYLIRWLPMTKPSLVYLGSSLISDFRAEDHVLSACQGQSANWSPLSAMQAFP
jgi:hypothetical protein